ncbi:MAG TPA: sugar ABC transporter ATP-binding protein [Gaiellaceae bacterium]|nr:sugar ABC transporter ATP-binding protein [Gaiellaceae bacterium]
MSASSPHIELRGVGKRFGGIQALHGIDLAIRHGSIHALVGENGAGKSTLGKIIAGVHRPDEGELLVDGRTVEYRAVRDALAHGTTIIAQEPTLVPHRSVLENVFLGVEDSVGGVVARRRLARRYAELVRDSGIELPPKRLARALSVADQQKAEILRAIARRVRLIIMDEPTSALTRDEAERLYGLIRRLRDSGTTIVYVSHLLAEVLRLADTVTVLRDGRHIRTGPAADETPERLVAAMLGRSIELTFPEKRPPPADAPVVLSVRGLSRPPAVREVSFEVRAGEIVGLAGLIGSGRTEVARAICGADRPAAGTVELAGRPLRLRSPREAIAQGLVMLPEDRKAQGLLMLRSVVDNVTLPYLRDVSSGGVIRPALERRRARDVVERLDVRTRSTRAAVSTLSGGNQQKVLFARWLFRRPRVLIADEPTRGIDIGAKRAIYELLHGLAAEGIAILLISSEHEEVLGLAHRVLVMRAGAIVAEFDHASMSEDAVLRAAFAADSPPTGRAA